MKRFIVGLMFVAGFNGFAQNQSKADNSANEYGKSVNAISTTNNGPKFTFYPNPAKSYITVNVDNANENTSYTLVNTIGKVVATEKITSSQITIDVNSLDDGIYILQITDVNGSTSKKVLVSKQNPSFGQ